MRPRAGIRWAVAWRLALVALPALGLELLALLAGLVMVPLGLAVGGRKWIVSREHGLPVVVFRRAPFWLWSNDCDGIYGPTESESTSTRKWIERTRSWPRWLRALHWCAVRNPVGNGRFTRLLGCRYPADIGAFMADPRGRFATNAWPTPNLAYKRDRAGGEGVRPCYWLLAVWGLRAGAWWIWPRGEAEHARLRLGWKIVPDPRPIDQHAALAAQASVRRKD